MFCIRYALRCGSKPALNQPTGFCLHGKDGEQEKYVHELGDLLSFTQKKMVVQNGGLEKNWDC